MASSDDKEESVRKLSITRQKAASLRARLKLLKENDKADEVSKRITKLDKRIEQLILAMMKAWKNNAKVRIEEIGQSNKRIQTAINGVKDRNKRAQQIVKAIGLIDDVIGIAAKFI